MAISDSGIPGFWDPSWIPGFWDLRILGPQDSGIPEFWDPRILGSRHVIPMKLASDGLKCKSDVFRKIENLCVKSDTSADFDEHLIVRGSV